MISSSPWEKILGLGARDRDEAGVGGDVLSGHACRWWSRRIGRNFLIRMIALGVPAGTPRLRLPLLWTSVAPYARGPAEVTYESTYRQRSRLSASHGRAILRRNNAGRRRGEGGRWRAIGEAAFVGVRLGKPGRSPAVSPETAG